MLKYLDKLERKATKKVLLIIVTLFELAFPNFKIKKEERMINLLISLGWIFSGVVFILVGIRGIIRNY